MIKLYRHVNNEYLNSVKKCWSKMCAKMFFTVLVVEQKR